MKNPIFKGNESIAYRDPACYEQEGKFYLFHTLSQREGDYLYNFVALTISEDLEHWSESRIITVKDRTLNFCSPGNVLKFGEKFILCLTSYPLPQSYYEREYATDDARIFTMESDDLLHWSSPKLLKVKGNHVTEQEMGRMIDPFIFEDKDEKGKFWIVYKQNGMSMSYSYDLENWIYYGNIEAGENACIIVENDQYILFHSPENGIGVKKSTDLKSWTDEGLLDLGQAALTWASGRLTAGFVCQPQSRPGYAMFFHGSVAGSYPEIHGEASLAMALSTDLVHWRMP